MSYGRMEAEERRLSGEIEALLAAAGEADAAEDARLGADVRGDELPAELRRREDRLAAIRAAKSRLEAQQRAADDARGRQPDQDRHPKGGRPYKRGYGEPDEKAQSNFTDPESGIMKTSSEGFQQCYNAQVAVEGEHPVGGGDGGDGERERPGRAAAAARRGGGDGRRAAGDGAGGRRVPATSGTWRTWKRGASTGMCRWAGRGTVLGADFAQKGPPRVTSTPASRHHGIASVANDIRQPELGR